MSDIHPSLFEAVELKLFGFFERGKDTYTECPTHGIVKAYVHGYKEKVECPTCFLKEMRGDAKAT